MYSDRECVVCKKPAVGFASNMVYRKYYCNRHYFGMSKRVDDWLAQREVEQWGDQQWYIDLKNPDFNSMENLTKVFGQVKLLSED